MDFWYQFKSCPFQTSCQTESLVAYLTMEACVLFHPKIWIVYQNSSPVLKSGCQIESFVSYLTMEFSLKATCQHGFLVDLYGSLICMNFSMDMNSSLVLLKLDVKLNLLSHISQWNFVCNFIQSCLPLKSCHFKSRCPIEAFVAYLKMKSCLLFHLKLWIF